MILQNKIDSEEDITCKWCDIDTKKGKNYQHVTNEIIETLGGFADMQDLPTACDLFFQYLQMNALKCIIPNIFHFIFRKIILEIRCLF